MMLPAAVLLYGTAMWVTTTSCQNVPSTPPASEGKGSTASVDADTAGIIGIVLTGFALLGILAVIIYNARTRHDAEEVDEEQSATPAQEVRVPVYRSSADSVPYRQPFAVGQAQKPSGSSQAQPNPQPQSVSETKPGRQAPTSSTAHELAGEATKTHGGQQDSLSPAKIKLDFTQPPANAPSSVVVQTQRNSSLESHTTKTVSGVSLSPSPPPPSAAGTRQDELPEYLGIIGSIDEALETNTTSAETSVVKHEQGEKITMASASPERIHVSSQNSYGGEGATTPFYQSSQVQQTATSSFTSTSLSFQNYAYEEYAFASADYAATHSGYHLSPVSLQVTNDNHQTKANQGKEPDEGKKDERIQGEQPEEENAVYAQVVKF